MPALFQCDPGQTSRCWYFEIVKAVFEQESHGELLPALSIVQSRGSLNMNENLRVVNPVGISGLNQRNRLPGNQRLNGSTLPRSS
jgi:hypothetical protein